MKHQILDVLASLAIDGKGQKCLGGWVIKWFKHDADASLDAKLQDILLDFGATGYGLYWYCVELIAKDVTPRNITFELEHDVRVISRNLNLSVKEVENMMQRMIDLGLFDISKNNKLACIKLVYRLDDSTRKGAQIDGIVADFYRENPELVGKIPNDSGKVRLDIDKEEDIEEEKEGEEEIEEYIIALPTNKKDQFHFVTTSDFDEYKELYQAVDVTQELKKMLGWLNANPTKRKTKNGMKRFVNGWLCREQDKGANIVFPQSKADAINARNKAVLDEWLAAQGESHVSH